MSNDARSFLDLCLAGKARPDEIDDAVEAWHQGVGAGDLKDHLGMSSDQYWRWVSDPRQLTDILAERRRNGPLQKRTADIAPIKMGNE